MASDPDRFWTDDDRSSDDTDRDLRDDLDLPDDALDPDDDLEDGGIDADERPIPFDLDRDDG